MANLSNTIANQVNNLRSRFLSVDPLMSYCSCFSLHITHNAATTILSQYSAALLYSTSMATTMPHLDDSKATSIPRLMTTSPDFLEVASFLDGAQSQETLYTRRYMIISYNLTPLLKQTPWDLIYRIPVFSVSQTRSRRTRIIRGYTTKSFPTLVR